MKKGSKKTETPAAPLNRAIRTDHNEAVASDLITLEVQEDTMLNGTSHKKGDRVQVSKSEARRLLTVRKATFRIA